MKRGVPPGFVNPKIYSAVFVVITSLKFFQMDQEQLTPAEDLEEDFMKTPSPDKSDPPRYRRASDSRGRQGRSSVSSRHSGQAVTSSSEEDRNP